MSIASQEGVEPMVNKTSSTSVAVLSATIQYYNAKREELRDPKVVTTMDDLLVSLKKDIADLNLFVTDVEKMMTEGFQVETIHLSTASGGKTENGQTERLLTVNTTKTMTNEAQELTRIPRQV